LFTVKISSKEQSKCSIVLNKWPSGVPKEERKDMQQMEARREQQNWEKGSWGT
jgi:hypothetical protein